MLLEQSTKVWAAAGWGWSLAIMLALPGCGAPQDDPAPTAAEGSTATAMEFRYAKNVRIERHGNYTVVSVSGPVADGGGTTPTQDVVVLVPRDTAMPVLPRTLADAPVIRTPVRTVATNSGADEAFLTQLGIADRLVAVGGTASYDATIRARSARGELAQLGYNWHAPPSLDVLVRRTPDVFLMRLGSLEHADALAKARRLGIPVLPTFAEDEVHYLGRAEWLRVYGLLAGEEERAGAVFEEISSAVEKLRALAATREPTPVLWAYPNGADRWIVTVRGSEGALLADANGHNLAARPEKAGSFPSDTMSTEALLPFAAEADVWILGDIHAVPPRNSGLFRGLPAWRNGHLYGNTARIDTAANAYDWYQTGVVRPDWVLRDLVKVLHPQLVQEPFVFLKPLAQGEFR
nr:ABC transporter substrate-binding protein [uncultured Pseudoxanthomonas sp.]